MAVKIRGKNITVTPALKDYVEKKLVNITKQFKTVGDITAVMRVEKDSHIVEITVPASGIVIRAQEDSNDMYASIDKCVDKIARQIHKYKTRLMIIGWQRYKVETANTKVESIMEYGALVRIAQSEGVPVEKVMSFASISTVALSLLVLGLFLLMVLNANNLAQYLENQVQVTVYMQDGIRDDTVQAAQKSLETMEEIQVFPFVKALIVDDQENSCKYLEALLKRFNVETAITTSGSAALSALNEANLQGKPFNLCLLDWKMPGMDGLEVAKKIQDMKFKNLKVAM